MAAPETLQARRAALLLHGLPDAARRQVLARLDMAEQDRLRPLLQELAELGIPAAADLPPIEVGPAAPALDRAAGLRADAVAQALQSCAPATVARLLRAAAWPWKDAVLAQGAASRRDAIVARMHDDTPALAPAVLACLCERLCAEAARQAGQLPKLPHGWRRLIAWTR